MYLTRQEKARRPLWLEGDCGGKWYQRDISGEMGTGFHQLRKAWLEVRTFDFIVSEKGSHGMVLRK